jgi:NDP-sugar pyrophosphorylase family protein
MIVHQIEALVAAGVTDIVLAVNYRPEIMEKFLAEVSLHSTPHCNIPCLRLVAQIYCPSRSAPLQ